MKKFEIPEPGSRMLRSFAVTMAVGLVSVFGLVMPWLFDKPWPIWPWPVAAGMLTILRIPYILWMRLGILLGMITSPIILGILFFGVFTPVGFFRRLLGKDSVVKSFNQNSKTYKVISRQPDRKNIERPF